MKKVVSLAGKRAPMEAALLSALSDVRCGAVELLTVIYTRSDGTIVQHRLAASLVESALLSVRPG